MVLLRVGPAHRARQVMIPAPCIARWMVSPVVQREQRLRAAQLAGRVEDVLPPQPPVKVHRNPLRCPILSSVTPTQSLETQCLHEECDHPHSGLVKSLQVALHLQAVNMVHH